MKQILLVIIFFLSSYTFPLYSILRGGISDIRTGYDIDARIVGTASANSTLSYDISSLYYNPAGLALVKKYIILASYMPYWDSSFHAHLLGVSFPNTIMCMGTGIMNIISDSIKVRFQSPKVNTITAYQQSFLFISAGYALLKELTLGMRINLIYEKIMDYKSTTGNIDLSLLWRSNNPYYYTPYKLLKIMKPVSIGFIIYNIADKKYPLVLKGGISYQLKCIISFFKIEPVIGVKSVPSANIIRYNAGGEIKLWEFFFIRTGYKILDKMLTIGTGINIKKISIDYAMIFLEMNKNLYTFTIKIKLN